MSTKLNDTNKNNQQENQGYQINFDLINGVKNQPKPQIKQEVYKPKSVPKQKPEEHRGSLQRVIADLKFDKPKYSAPHVSREVVKQKKVKSRVKPQKQYSEKSHKFPKFLRVLLWIILAINLA